MLLRSLLAATAAFLLAALPASAAEFRAGYVDYQRVLSELDDVKNARSRFQKWMEGRQKELDGEQETLRKEKATLEKQLATMDEKVRQEKSEEFQKKLMELAKKLEKAQAEAVEKEQKEVLPIRNRIDEIVARIADREGLSMVFDKQASGLVYAQSQFDLTNEVIRTYNSSAKPKAKDAPTKN